MAGASLVRLPKAKAAQSLLGPETFGLYDSLLFIGKPDLSPYGFKRCRTVYQNELWPPKADYTTPNEAAVRSKARAVLAEGVTAAVPIILDVEKYSVDVRLDISHLNPDTSTVDANILKLQQIIGWFKLIAAFYSLGLQGNERTKSAPLDCALAALDRYKEILEGSQQERAKSAFDRVDLS